VKIACVLISHFPWSAESHRRPELADKPTILVNAQGGQRQVLDFSPVLPGLLAGMPLQTALSRCEGVTLVDADTSYYQETYETILKNLEQAAPAVENSGLGCAYLDIAGLEEAYGSRDALLKTIFAAIPPAFKAKTGIAANKFTSYVAAVDAKPGQVVEVNTEARDFLRDHPVDILPVSWRSIERLRGFGLTTLGQVAASSSGPLQAQFGREGYEIWHLSNGIDNSPILPWHSTEFISEYLSFPAPTVASEVILLGADTLLSRAFSRPQLKGRCARAANLKSQTSNGSFWQRRLTFKEPLGSKSRALFAIKSAIESLTFPGPLEDLELVLSGLTGEKGRQESLFLHIRRQEQFNEALRHLQARMGKKPVIFQVKRMEPWSRIPERRQALIPFNSVPPFRKSATRVFDK